MDEYTLSHRFEGERQRLALMSELLDPIELAHLARLGLGPGWRCLELGCGNGSISQASPSASYPRPRRRQRPRHHLHRGAEKPCLEVRRIDVLNDAIEAEAYDLVVARALLHHLTPAQKALERMVEALKPGECFSPSNPTCPLHRQTERGANPSI